MIYVSNDIVCCLMWTHEIWPLGYQGTLFKTTALIHPWDLYTVYFVPTHKHAFVSVNSILCGGVTSYRTHLKGPVWFVPQATFYNDHVDIPLPISSLDILCINCHV